MAWRKVEESDLISSLSLKEVDAFRKSAEFEHDPVEQLLAGVVAKVRGYIRASRTVPLDPDESTIPEALVTDAMDYLRYEILTRMNVVVNESRTKAYERAVETFKEVANGSFKVEPGVDPVPAGSVAVPSISVKPPIL